MTDTNRPETPADLSAQTTPEDPQSPELEASLPDLATEFAALQAQLASAEDARLRAAAETENLRRRMQEDVVKAHKFAIESFAQSMIEVHDNLTRALSLDSPALEVLREGVGMTLKQFDTAFEKFRVLPLVPAAGDKLNPLQHQAVATVASPVPANHIVEVMQKGYLIADRLLRPALVVVSQGPAASESDAA